MILSCEFSVLSDIVEDSHFERALGLTHTARGPTLLLLFPLAGRKVYTMLQKRKKLKHCHHYVRSGRDLTFLLSNETFLTKSLKMSISNRKMCLKGFFAE